jgi:transcriptional antiterminator
VVKSSPKSSPKIIQLIDANPYITALEIAEKLGLSKRAVLKNIKKLKE